MADSWYSSALNDKIRILRLKLLLTNSGKVDSYRSCPRMVFSAILLKKELIILQPRF